MSDYGDVLRNMVMSAEKAYMDTDDDTPFERYLAGYLDGLVAAFREYNWLESTSKTREALEIHFMNKEARNEH